MSRIHRYCLPMATVLFALSVAGSLAYSADSNEAHKLGGLWGSERIFSPSSPIRVTIQFSEDETIASALGATAPVTTNGELVEFILPHGLGSFRGAKKGRNGDVVGHWISDPVDVLYSQYATPLSLTRITADTWTGTVTPVEERFSLYFFVELEPSGKMRALLRNPERNQGVFTRVAYVELDETDVWFLDIDGERLLSGVFDETAQSLTVNFPGRGGRYEFTRRQRSNAPGYYPRRDTSNYRYRRPVDLADGWTVTNPEDVNMRAADLENLVQSIMDTETTSIRTPYIHSLLVARRGKLVLEEYFYGYHSDRVHDLRSASKSVTGILAGQAIDEVKDLDEASPVYSIFTDIVATGDERRQRMTVQHLLTMSSGLACDDNDYDSPGNEDRMHDQEEQPDWWQYALDLPISSDPGEVAVYCSAGINLLGGVISESTFVWLPEFFRSRLAEPLQIENYHMNLDPLGRGYAGGGLRMRPRDFLKIAQMMANKGTWNERRVLSERWATEALQPRVSIYEEGDYGYAWWTGELPYKDSKVASYSATGNGGQLLIIVPALDLVVGITGGNYGDFRTWIAWREELVPRHVFGAISD